MAIVEFTINTSTKCYRCVHLDLNRPEAAGTIDEYYASGKCVCETNRVRNRYRAGYDRACSHKQTRREKHDDAET